MIAEAFGHLGEPWGLELAAAPAPPSRRGRARRRRLGARGPRERARHRRADRALRRPGRRDPRLGDVRAGRARAAGLARAARRARRAARGHAAPTRGSRPSTGWRCAATRAPSRPRWRCSPPRAGAARCGRATRSLEAAVRLAALTGDARFAPYLPPPEAASAGTRARARARPRPRALRPRLSAYCWRPAPRVRRAARPEPRRPRRRRRRRAAAEAAAAEAAEAAAAAAAAGRRRGRGGRGRGGRRGLRVGGGLRRGRGGGRRRLCLRRRGRLDLGLRRGRGGCFGFGSCAGAAGAGVTGVAGVAGASSAATGSATAGARVDGRAGRRRVRRRLLDRAVLGLLVGLGSSSGWPDGVVVGLRVVVDPAGRVVGRGRLLVGLRRRGGLLGRRRMPSGMPSPSVSGLRGVGARPPARRRCRMPSPSESSRASFVPSPSVSALSRSRAGVLLGLVRQAVAVVVGCAVGVRRVLGRRVAAGRCRPWPRGCRAARRCRCRPSPSSSGRRRSLSALVGSVLRRHSS